MQHARLADVVPTEALSDTGRSLDLGAFPGTWVNSNPDTPGFTKVEFQVSDDGRLACRVVGIGPDGPIDWGYADDIELYGATPSAAKMGGFTARYSFDFMDVQLEGNLNKGLMVLVTLTRFKDNSGRCDYFMREYFSVTHELFA